MIHFGTSSFSERDWIGPFYPRGTPSREFLRYYASRYSTVEIDATYYGIPTARTVEGWVRKTPDRFLIAAKFPREIVHAGAGPRPDPEVLLTPETYPARDEFLQAISGLGERQGPLLIQFPWFAPGVFPSPGAFLERLDRFLGDLPGEFDYAVEIRNEAWLTPEYAGLLREHGVALTLVDLARMPHGDEIEAAFDPVTAGFSYVRLVGDRRFIERVTDRWDREVIDREDRLLRWAGVLSRLLDREVPTFAYVNNHYAGHAPATVERLRRLFSRASGQPLEHPPGDLFGPC